MTRATILAAVMLALAASAGAAQSIGVSAVILEPVEVAPVEYEVRLGADGYDVDVKREAPVRSLLLEHTIVERGPQVQERSAAGRAGAEAGLLEEERVETESDRLLVTRVIAANA